MGFKVGSYAKIWKVENKGNYSIVELSISKKNKQSNQYETDFSSKFVRFIGRAHTDIGLVQENCKIKLGDVEVTNSYNKDTKQSFTNFLVFSFETVEGQASALPSSDSQEWMSIPDLADSDLPFQ